MSDEECAWITKAETKPGTIRANVKMHKEAQAYRFIISSIGTAIENIGQWVEHHLSPLTKIHPAYIKDTQHFLRYIEQKNEELDITEKTRLVTRDIVNYYPSCDKRKCIESVRTLLTTRESNNPSEECILEAMEITMSSNQFGFMGSFYTQIDGATIGGKDSGSITDIFGAEVIDKKIREQCPLPTDHYVRYRDDTFEISELSEQQENAKTEWLNNNIYKNIKFEGKTSKDKIENLDTEISIEPDHNGNLRLVSDIYSKKTDTHQYLSPASCHPLENKKSIPYGVIHRVRRNCSDNVEGDTKFMNQAVNYKAYLMKSGYKPQDIDNQFVKILKYKRKDLLKEKSKKKKRTRNKKIRFITDFEPKFPSIANALKELEPLLLSDPLLKKMLPNGMRNIDVCYRRGGKNIKEFLATARVNKGETRLQLGGQTGCEKECHYCAYMIEMGGSTFRSNKTKRTYKLRQAVDCNAKWVVYMVTCKKCGEQGIGSTKTLKSRIALYKTTIQNRKQGKCGVDHHFLQQDHSWEDFSIQVLVKMMKEPKRKSQEKDAYTRLRKFEGYWQVQIATIAPDGMNTINEFHRNRYAQDKPSFDNGK